MPFNSVLLSPESGTDATGRERGVKPWVVTGPPPIGLLRVKARPFGREMDLIGVVFEPFC